MFSARRNTLDRLRKQPVARVLVVCHGNIYRSAFVGEHLRGRIGSRVEVRSAGFYPKTGRPAPERHVAMSRRHGVSLDRHASAVVTADDLDWADIIVLMDRRNWLDLRKARADPRKFVWLGAFTPGPVEIADPYAMDDVRAEALLSRLAASSEALAKTIVERTTGALRETTDAGRRG